MIDTVVYDIRSRKMLFRTTGTHKINSYATYIGLTEQFRKDSRLSFEEARKALCT